MSNNQKGVLAILAFIAFLELGISGRFGKLWGLAFNPAQATAAQAPASQGGGSVGQFSLNVPTYTL